MDRYSAGTVRSAVVIIAAGLHMSAASQPFTGLRAILKLSILSDGGGFQVISYNYSRQTMSVSPYKTGSSALPFLLPTGEQVGLYFYDYWGGRFTQAVYAAR